MVNFKPRLETACISQTYECLGDKKENILAQRQVNSGKLIVSLRIIPFRYFGLSALSSR